MDLYLLLYLPLAALTVFWLLAALRLAKKYRTLHHETALKTAGAVVAVALFDASFAVMVVTHARGFKAAMVLVMAMGVVNLFRLRGARRREASPYGELGTR